MPKITKAQFDLLCTDNITKKDYDAIISKIDIRFFEICRHIIPIGFWYDYGNCDDPDDYGNCDESAGYFDLADYNEYIEIGGDCEVPMPYSTLNEFGNAAIPTRWLWEDFEDEFKKEVENYKSEQEKLKIKQKQDKQALKEKKKILQAQIRSKLTKEELKVISFK